MCMCKVNNWIINRREKIVPKRRFKLVFFLLAVIEITEIKIKEKNVNAITIC